ncbi:hypothetical protein EVAR_48572_1 [Eumeta japonica]|uniref:Uncharacterized protein n=1 Tax=Eumeta variegata TaxID=151549 RepID=A0A4C1XD04_EUMVA|nr:hypothetical protein EVAR_48572_1 [Eumeta japonica]
MDSHRLRQFLAERGLLDLLRDFEAYCSSPASPEQANPDLEMEVELNTNKEPTKRPATARPSEGSTSSSSDSDAAGDGSTYHRITSSSKSLKRPTPKQNQQSRQIGVDLRRSRELEKTVQPTKATAPTVTSTRHEADEIVPLPGKFQRPPPFSFMIRDAGPKTSLCQSVRSLTAPESLGPSVSNSNTGIDQETKRSFYCISGMLPSGVKVSNLTRKAFLDNALIVKCNDIRPKLFPTRAAYAWDHGTAACIAKQRTDGPPACVLVNHPATRPQLLRLSCAPKRNTTQKNKTPPPARRVCVEARARGYAKLSYAKATAEPPYGPATPNKTKTHPLREH